MKKKVSLKDIATKVGVSTALVSYVLNNKREGRISKEIARKIRDVAEKMHYRPNQIAKSLKTNKTLTIGLIVADIANPFSSQIARIIEDEAELNNYSVIIGSSDEKKDKQLKLINLLLDRQVDGMIIAPAEDTLEQVKLIQEASIPFVLIDRYIPDLETSYVMIDNYNAAFKGVTHLVQSGYKKIGIIAFRTSLINLTERTRGYVEALKKNGLTVNKKFIKEVAVDITTEEEVIKSIQELLSGKDPVDAIFFASNKVSTYGLKYLNTLPVKVPQELGILSFDQSDAAFLFYAPLTHTRQPLKEMGEHAVRILLDGINDPKKITHKILEATLVIGKSTLKV